MFHHVSSNQTCHCRYTSGVPLFHAETILSASLDLEQRVLQSTFSQRFSNHASSLHRLLSPISTADILHILTLHICCDDRSETTSTSRAEPKDQCTSHSCWLSVFRATALRVLQVLHSICIHIGKHASFIKIWFPSARPPVRKQSLIHENAFTVRSS